jgi:hypothetical protein
MDDGQTAPAPLGTHTISSALHGGLASPPCAESVGASATRVSSRTSTDASAVLLDWLLQAAVPRAATPSAVTESFSGKRGRAVFARVRMGSAGDDTTALIRELLAGLHRRSETRARHLALPMTEREVVAAAERKRSAAHRGAVAVAIALVVGRVAVVTADAAATLRRRRRRAPTPRAAVGVHAAIAGHARVAGAARIRRSVARARLPRGTGGIGAAHVRRAVAARGA